MPHSTSRLKPVLRRDALKAMGGAALIAAPFGQQVPALGQCTVLSSPSLTEGPYFVDEELNRRDIRVDPSDGTVQAGIPLTMSIYVSQLYDCYTVPLTGAYVDVWHCNALGVYSDIGSQGSSGKKFLRGYQSTDRNGNVYFTTVYPGWYQGRTPHIHVKVRLFNNLNQTYEFTSQFFFDDTFTNSVYQMAPYNTRPSRDTFNPNDGIFQGASNLGQVTSNSGSYLMLSLNRKTSWIEADARLICDLRLGSSPDQTGPGGGGPGGMPPGGAPPPGGSPPPRP